VNKAGKSMLQSIKRLTKHSAVYGVGFIVSRSIGFLLLPIHTRYIAPEQYGIANLLFSSLAILNVIFSYGMDVAFLRFFILGQNKKEKERIFSTAHWMIFSTGILFFSVLFVFPGPFSEMIFRSSRYETLVRLSAGICFADALRLLPFLALRGEERSLSFMTLNSLNIIVTLLLNVLFVAVLKKGIEGIFIANLIASVFTVITTIPISLKWLRIQFSKSMLVELLKFGIPYVPSGLAVVIMDQISRFFIDRMIGTGATGIFSASYKFGMFMALVVAAFRFAWHPFFLSTVKQKDAPQIFARVLTYFLAVTGFFFLLISFFVQEIAVFKIFGYQIIGKKYVSGIQIVPIVMLAYIMYGVYANFIIGIYLKKKTTWLPFITGAGALVSVIANFFLIPHFGIIGAAWAVFIGYAAMAAVLYFANQRLYFIPYEFIRIVKLILIFGILFFIGTRFGWQWSGWMRLLLLGLLVPLLVVFRFFQKGEKAAFGRLVRKIRISI
jgi:O-antigen/teichoic acid export membrane protein